MRNTYKSARYVAFRTHKWLRSGASVNARLKLRHFVGFRFVHRQARRSAPSVFAINPDDERAGSPGVHMETGSRSEGMPEISHHFSVYFRCKLRSVRETSAFHAFWGYPSGPKQGTNRGIGANIPPRTALRRQWPFCRVFRVPRRGKNCCNTEVISQHPRAGRVSTFVLCSAYVRWFVSM